MRGISTGFTGLDAALARFSIEPFEASSRRLFIHTSSISFEDSSSLFDCAEFEHLQACMLEAYTKELMMPCMPMKSSALQLTQVDTDPVRTNSSLAVNLMTQQMKDMIGYSRSRRTPSVFYLS